MCCKLWCPTAYVFAGIRACIYAIFTNKKMKNGVEIQFEGFNISFIREFSFSFMHLCMCINV